MDLWVFPYILGIINFLIDRNTFRIEFKLLFFRNEEKKLNNNSLIHFQLKKSVKTDIE